SSGLGITFRSTSTAIARPLHERQTQKNPSPPRLLLSVVLQLGQISISDPKSLVGATPCGYPRAGIPARREPY
ncbi:MAG: hypothetical protein ACYSWW_26635, partial [Planctomycetota bacterium]